MKLNYITRSQEQYLKNNNIVLTDEQTSIINNYDDNTLIDIIITLDKVDDMESLLNFLEFASTHNYYTGSVWSPIYKGLEEKTRDIIDNEEYFKYIVEKLDYKDIFIIEDSGKLIEIEKNQSEINKFLLKEYDEILTLEYYENVYYYDELETFNYINECFFIPTHLESYINYKDILNELDHDPGVYTFDDETMIINDNER